MNASNTVKAIAAIVEYDYSCYCFWGFGVISFRLSMGMT